MRQISGPTTQEPVDTRRWVGDFHGLQVDYDAEHGLAVLEVNDRQRVLSHWNEWSDEGLRSSRPTEAALQLRAYRSVAEWGFDREAWEALLIDYADDIVEHVAEARP